MTKVHCSDHRPLWVPTPSSAGTCKVDLSDQRGRCSWASISALNLPRAGLACDFLMVAAVRKGAPDRYALTEQRTAELLKASEEPRAGPLTSLGPGTGAHERAHCWQKWGPSCLGGKGWHGSADVQEARREMVTTCFRGTGKIQN